MKVDLVFEGGGVLGISFVGALKSLRENGYEFERCAGTSAGAIVASLVIAGYTVEELFNIMSDTDYKCFKKASYFNKVPVPKAVEFLSKKGLYNGDNIEEWIRPLLEAKGVTKFKHVMKNGKSRLRIIASDVTKSDMLVLPDDLYKYGIKPEEFEIAKAVRMSASIPFYFTPCILNYKSGWSCIVDGGLLSNFPIWIFDVEGLPRWPTFGLRFRNLKKSPKKDNCSMYSYIQDIINAPININGERFIRDKDLVRTITIDYEKVKATDFDKASKFKDMLFAQGYNCTEEFLARWNFQRYVQVVRMGYGGKTKSV